MTARLDWSAAFVSVWQYVWLSRLASQVHLYVVVCCWNVKKQVWCWCFAPKSLVSQYHCLMAIGNQPTNYKLANHFTGLNGSVSIGLQITLSATEVTSEQIRGLEELFFLCMHACACFMERNTCQVHSKKGGITISLPVRPVFQCLAHLKGHCLCEHDSKWF